MATPNHPEVARPLRRGALLTSLVALGIAALTGCAAFANDATTTSTTVAPTAPLKTDASSTPNPIPANDRILPIGEVALAVDDRERLGEIIVDASGRTLYVFSRDGRNDPTCYGACADTWLPVLAKNDPTGAIGINVAEAGTAERGDGSNQATYRGQPLYRYAGDKINTDAKGQGLDLFGGEWHVLTQDGVPLA
ncbi:COG4315 family predicted lipoprotein [Mycobacterium sp. IDR2000157661]|uniref:COG4315 family predicted lipoprotein n=1 Tax=Mycobacterium sp. IDR2000157661 TaxID=2867005 RepID=UPI001EEDA3D2|nr:hypothetical protein [Mycobacterium sp. IDR2000157661]ULE34677.1 hypothetical protein K3G64_08830 [Mycobacterium sp. IDR2000157661]